MQSSNLQQKRRYGSRRIFPLEYELNLNDFTKSNRNIKKGGFSSICFYTDKKTNKEYAKKTSIKALDKRNKLYLYREVNILINVQHPTIIPFKGYSIEKDNYGEKKISIFTEYMKNGSLDDMIEKEIKGQLPIDFNNTKKQIILVGIARGMMLLHKKLIIHRDLKPQNVLLDEELLKNSFKFGNAIAKGFRPDYSKVKKKSLRRMIKFCLSKNPTKRPSFSELYNKLSLSEEEFFIENGNGICEPVIDDEEYDEDDDEKDSEDDEEKVDIEEEDEKYCLDDVDVDELQLYIDKIDDEITIGNMNEDLEEMKAKNKQNESQIKKLEKENFELKENNDNLTKKYENMKNIALETKRENQELQENYETLCEKTNQMQENINELIKLVLSLKSDKENSMQQAISPPKIAEYQTKSPRHSPSNDTRNSPQPSTNNKKNFTQKLPNKDKRSFPQKTQKNKKFYSQQIQSNAPENSPRSKVSNQLPYLKKDKNDQIMKTDQKFKREIREKIIKGKQLPPDIDTIFEELFIDCTDIESIQIPSSINTIENAAFYGCTALINVEIPPSVTSIGNFCFYKCISLVEIKLPPSLKVISSHIFDECTSLTNIEIPPNVKRIGIAAFYNCKSLETIKIPESVEFIDKSAFCYCTSLQSIDIPSKVTTIEFNTFCGCTSLQKVNFHENLIEINNTAFSDCTSLQFIEIPSKVTSIDSTVFKNCSSLKNARIPITTTFYADSFPATTVIDKY